MDRNTPTFHIDDIPIYGDLVLSPMDGYSDQPFRSLARELGSALSYTEFVNAIDVVNKNPNLELRLRYTPLERPVVYQIFDDDPDRLVRAALILREFGPDIIDINMGCSAKNVSGRGAGAGLLCTPYKISAIFNRLNRELDIPVTGKIRLGWDDSTKNYLEIAKIVEENGGKLLAVHGRTRAQGYTGEADWEAIREVKQAVTIPVLGNGDVRSVADIARIKEKTGCDGVMIGRAAIGNPWIFSRLDRAEIPPDLVRATMVDHLQRMIAFYGSEQGLILFRKHASRYISPYQLEREFRERLLTCESADDFCRLFDQIMQAHLVET
ncbi:MAG TPA: tRNA dihydrouridine synthase DusB [Anaerolineaceae bacterium]|nr:tRNA dihydrouridine synthase DusB [Anaerolineaceae bacterium]